MPRPARASTGRACADLAEHETAKLRQSNLIRKVQRIAVAAGRHLNRPRSYEALSHQSVAILGRQAAALQDANLDCKIPEVAIQLPAHFQA